MADITIGFVPRDRFCKAAESLTSILEFTERPFHLVVVDTGAPPVIRQAVDELLLGQARATVLRPDGTISSNRARNIVIGQTTTEFLCLIENDCIVEPGWLEYLHAACVDHPADVVAPLLFEPRGAASKVHFDDRLGSIRRQQGGKLEILSRATPLEADRTAERRPTDFVEMHCLFFRRSVFERIGPFDDAQHGSRAEVDLSLALWVAGVPTVLEPRSRVTFLAPPPVHPDERDHYLRYWDLDGASADHRAIEARWNLVECPSAIGFVKGRRRLAEETPDVQLRRRADDVAAVDLIAREIDRYVPEDDTLILVDEAQWVAGDVVGARRAFPFLEHDGQYWGAPTDDATAISEFERLRRSGASFIVFGWPAFWWLDHYQGFSSHLRSNFHCVLRNERVLIFDLRRG